MMRINFVLRAVFFNFAVIAFFWNATAYSMPATKEQAQFINSLSAQQLYELYVEQSLQMAGQMVKNKAFLQNQRVRLRIKECFIKLLESTFTEKEMREIFIQPVGMDTDYYQRKINQISYDIESCILNAVP